MLVRAITPSVFAGARLQVDLIFDFWVEFDFYWTGRLPTGLMEEIGKAKQEVYGSLCPHPLQRDMLVTDRVFLVEKRRFHVYFAVDRQQANMSAESHQLHVIQINEVR
jgi:hypothetical protein